MKFNMGTNYINKYKLKYPNKYITNINDIKKTTIEYYNEKELYYLNKFDIDDQILVWGFKEFSINYIHFITKEEKKYIPSFYVCRQLDKNIEKIEEFILDLNKVNIYDIYDITEDYYKKMNIKDKLKYKDLQIKQTDQLCKFQKIYEYCKTRNIDFFIYDDTNELLTINNIMKFDIIN